MRYFLFADHFGFMPFISGLVDVTDDMTVIKVGGFPHDNDIKFPGRLFERESISPDWLARLNISRADRVLIMAQDPKRFDLLVDHISKSDTPPPILFLTDKAMPLSRGAAPNISVVNVPSMVGLHLANEWRLIGIREKAYRLWRTLSSASSVLIMTQDDPDPDAIASGMAIQALIGDSPESSPIATLGHVIRNENISMLRLLDTRVRTIKPEEIGQFEKVVMVDVQPPYFDEGLFENVAVVIDHHPYPPGYEAEFTDINVSYGATSTMMSEYLIAGGIKITERLATALLYGVITDTMLLARESSARDFEAFSHLWPMANHQMLSSMSRPRLNPEELNYFVRAIHNRRMVGDFLFVWLGSVKRDDIIPRLADFSLQIGDTSFSAVCGVHQDNIVISLRNNGAETDAGKLASSLFSGMGSAGGHRTMAKAIFPLALFQKTHGVKSMKQVKKTLLDILSRVVSD